MAQYHSSASSLDDFIEKKIAPAIHDLYQAEFRKNLTFVSRELQLDDRIFRAD